MGRTFGGRHSPSLPEGIAQASQRRSVSIEFCGISLTLGLTVAEAVEQAFTAPHERLPITTTFVNPHSFHIAKRDNEYAANLSRFTYVFPDGIGVTWALRLLHSNHAERISFDSTSLALPMLRRAQREHRSVMLIGGRPGVAPRAAERLSKALDGLRVLAATDGFRSLDQYVSTVHLLKPDVIVCGMGAPLQEELLIRLAESGAWKGLGYTCGGYLDQLCAGVQYYPAVVDRLDLRWAYRLAKEPRRLWRRYLIEYQSFFGALLNEAWCRLGGNR
jgi:N-acetylglucosaminyldiphosphoundecaprenol N-acetyl-beta-D-mannosaminyltransferase